MIEESEIQLGCLVIDDDRSARELIRKHLERIPFVTMLAECKNAYEALTKIHELSPDIIFLDIQMAGMTGFELLSALGNIRTSVIIVSGNPSFALTGFDYQVTDFLLKPVTFERFTKAVAKAVRERYHSVPSINSSSQAIKFPKQTPEHPGYVFLKENKQLVRVELSSIQVVEAMKDYLKIYREGVTHIIHQTMANIEESLPANLFIRVHRSFIVNRSSIVGFDGNQIKTSGDRMIPVGRTYRDMVLASLSKYSI